MLNIDLPILQTTKWRLREINLHTTQMGEPVFESVSLTSEPKVLMTFKPLEFYSSVHWRPDIWVFFPWQRKETHAGISEPYRSAVQTCCCKPTACASSTLMVNSCWDKFLTTIPGCFTPSSIVLKGKKFIVCIQTNCRIIGTIKLLWTEVIWFRGEKFPSGESFRVEACHVLFLILPHYLHIIMCHPLRQGSSEQGWPVSPTLVAIVWWSRHYC